MFSFLLLKLIVDSLFGLWFMAPWRVHLFYNPKLYIAPPKKELTREERVYQNSGLAAATTAAPVAFVQGRPAPPPETFEGAYGKLIAHSWKLFAKLIWGELWFFVST